MVYSAFRHQKFRGRQFFIQGEDQSNGIRRKIHIQQIGTDLPQSGSNLILK